MISKFLKNSGFLAVVALFFGTYSALADASKIASAFEACTYPSSEQIPIREQLLAAGWRLPQEDDPDKAARAFAELDLIRKIDRFEVGGAKAWGEVSDSAQAELDVAQKKRLVLFTRKTKPSDPINLLVLEDSAFLLVTEIRHIVKCELMSISELDLPDGYKIGQEDAAKRAEKYAGTTLANIAAVTSWFDVTPDIAPEVSISKIFMMEVNQENLNGFLENASTLKANVTFSRQ